MYILPVVLKYVSIICESISAAPQAVWYGETVKVFLGLRKETLGCIRGEATPILSLVSKLLITPPASISEPVAERVRIVTRGRQLITGTFFVTISQASPS